MTEINTAWNKQETYLNRMLSEPISYDYGKIKRW